MNNETSNNPYSPIYLSNQYPTQLVPYPFIYNDMQNRANEHQRLNNSYFHWEQGGGLPPLLDSYNVTSLPLSTANATNPKDISQPRNYSIPMTSGNSASCNSLCVCTGKVLFSTCYIIH